MNQNSLQVDDRLQFYNFVRIAKVVCLKDCNRPISRHENSEELFQSRKLSTNLRSLVSDESWPRSEMKRLTAYCLSIGFHVLRYNHANQGVHHGMVTKNSGGSNQSTVLTASIASLRLAEQSPAYPQLNFTQIHVLSLRCKIPIPTRSSSKSST